MINSNETPVLTVNTFRAGQAAVSRDAWQIEVGFRVLNSRQSAKARPENRGRTHRGSLANAVRRERELLNIPWDARTIMLLSRARRLDG